MEKFKEAQKESPKEAMEKKFWNELRAVASGSTKSTFRTPVPKPTDPKVIGALKFVDHNAMEFQKFCKENKIKATVDLSEVEDKETRIDARVVGKMAIYLASKMESAGQDDAAKALIKGVEGELRKRGVNMGKDKDWRNATSAFFGGSQG